MKIRFIIYIIFFCFSNHSYSQTIINVKLLAVSPPMNEGYGSVTLILDTSVQCGSGSTDIIRVTQPDYDSTGARGVSLHSSLVNAAKNELVVAIDENSLTGSPNNCQLLLDYSVYTVKAPLNIYYQ